MISLELEPSWILYWSFGRRDNIKGMRHFLSIINRVSVLGKITCYLCAFVVTWVLILNSSMAHIRDARLEAHNLYFVDGL